jgi:2-C-methyl-D-erythritol 4-phosphate cytidylyltransferase
VRGSVWTIVLAAGAGARFGGGQPKQYQALGARRVLDWSLDVARRVSEGVVLVVDATHAGDPEPADVVVVGGTERSDSVRAGLAAVPHDAGIVVVHDAARPLATDALFARVVERVRLGADAAIPAVAVTDTIKRERDGWVIETLDRHDLRAVQTPQAFRAGVLREAHRHAPHATDDAALVEALGHEVAVVAGEARNLKITRADDLSVVRLLLEQGRQ